MIRINKGNEPKEWTKKRETAGAVYEAIPELKDALLAEQGHICAYCMRRVPVAKKDPGNVELARIEHIKCRTDYPQHSMDYDNMVICCPGYINGSEHCDKAKHDKAIRFSPFDPRVEESISYSTKDGMIKSAEKAWNEDFDTVLVLNDAMLRLNRKNAIDGARAYLERKKWKEAELKQLLDGWSAKDKEGKYRPYCGAVIWYIKRAIRAGQNPKAGKAK
ncbi:hypothetical protein [Mucilaginibacter lacusdianchii]|uniref:hypothetical protein n=1 Tax=Mucilaginibacter lacusdianchii TaxID=2684211 RepID=UPI00131E71B8|nr:hypothetical protein [Mucilaginibacter sp. JXJ CY 39]